jgi:hypothetical protein
MILSLLIYATSCCCINMNTSSFQNFDSFLGSKFLEWYMMVTADGTN